jgi:hypothetical protein
MLPRLLNTLILKDRNVRFRLIGTALESQLPYQFSDLLKLDIVRPMEGVGLEV